MKKKVKITTAISVAIISLLMIPLYNKPLKEPLIPDTSSVSAPTTSSRDNPLAENKVLVGEETAKISTQNPLQDSTPTETDYEPPSPADNKAVLAESSDLGDNLTPTPVPSKNTTAAKATAPKMGDTRIVGGQKQVYFLGFGWIDDNDEPNECIYAEDMYENGNKIAIMGSGIIGQSDGDINKMVGRMD